MPPRIPIEVGGIYHIMNRGVDKRNIFIKDQDYARFVLGLHFFNNENPSDIWTNLKYKTKETLAILGRPGGPSKDDNGRKPIVELLAFVLMPNHYHLIVQEVLEGGIRSFMQKLGGGYAWYFNKQYDRSGALFQGRYKAVLVKDEIQLGTVFVYVHTNPVELQEPQWKDLKVTDKRKAINWMSQYKWSSYHDYIGNTKFPVVTQRDFFLNFYGSEKDCQNAVEDWIIFKAENAKLGSEIIE